jgi:hypothetical protein
MHGHDRYALCQRSPSGAYPAQRPCSRSTGETTTLEQVGARSHGPQNGQKKPKMSLPSALGAAAWRLPSAAPRRSSTPRPALSLSTEPAPAAAMPPSNGRLINGRQSYAAAVALHTCDLAAFARRSSALHPLRHAVALPRPNPPGPRARSGCRPGAFEGVSFPRVPRKAAASYACCGVNSGGSGAGGEAGDTLGGGWRGGGASAASA